MKMTVYGESGVDYDLMDKFKIEAQETGRKTSGNLEYFNMAEVEESRGESAYLIDRFPEYDEYLAHVNESLGTKSLVADAMYELNGAKRYYKNITKCAVAMIVNDIITPGAMPISISMNLAVGDSDWFKDEVRWQAIIDGWKEACDISGCSYGGGETAVLKNIVFSKLEPQNSAKRFLKNFLGNGLFKTSPFVLSGSAIGIIKPRENILIGSKLRDGDAIILVESSGVQANGITLVRKMVEKRDSILKKIGHFLFPNNIKLFGLPHSYETVMDNGRIFGEALLDPTIIYAPLIRECFNREVVLHYASHITGHGWRKIMRAKQKFCYVIGKIPGIQGTIFEFLLEQLQRQNNLEYHAALREAYAIFNMGAGFAIYAPEKEAVKIIQIAESFKMKAFYAGYIEKSEKEKKVIIEPLNMVFKEQDLKIRD